MDQEDDYVEPDLSKYASIDMSTLQDVRKTGMDYVLSMEAVLHTTPGLEPGYLPEKDALHMLSGVSPFLLIQTTLHSTSLPFSRSCHNSRIPFVSLQGMNLMCIACFLDEKSTKLKHEGMDRMRVALAGSPPYCFLSLMGDFFGYQDSVPTPSDLAAAPTEPVPAPTLPAAMHPKDPSAYQTLPDIGSGPEYAGPSKGPQPSLATPYQAGAKGVKPGDQSEALVSNGTVSRISASFSGGEGSIQMPLPRL